MRRYLAFLLLGLAAGLGVIGGHVVTTAAATTTKLSKYSYDGHSVATGQQAVRTGLLVRALMVDAADLGGDYPYDPALEDVRARPVGVSPQPRSLRLDRFPLGEAASLTTSPVALVVAAETEPGLANDLATARNSFAPATLVVLADGSAKAISQVAVGDRVRTTDPATGKTVIRTVTALHRNHDTDLADLVVRDGHGLESTVHTTQHHRFWDDTRHGWFDETDLTVGDLLDAGDGNIATVESVKSLGGREWMYDLTVAGRFDVARIG